VVGHGEKGGADCPSDSWMDVGKAWTSWTLGTVGLECLECLEAFPTPSSAVTGMKRGGPSLALLYTCRDAPDVGLVRR
jgi:hypothetical protein